VSVRLWLRIRADITEPGFLEFRRWQYANADFSPTGADARHRRRLVSRTVALRNLPRT
jgi:hypothetical protein